MLTYEVINSMFALLNKQAKIISDIVFSINSLKRSFCRLIPVHATTLIIINIRNDTNHYI